MKLISHRGNISSKQPSFENSPSYIKEALSAGYGVEADFWYKDDQWFLGHDEPEYKVNEIEWYMFNLNMFMHAKDIPTFIKMKEMQIEYAQASDMPVIVAHYFYHTNEPVILTSRGMLWAFPKVEVPSKYACAVMPEYAGWDKYKVEQVGFGAVCSDKIESFQ